MALLLPEAVKNAAELLAVVVPAAVLVGGAAYGIYRGIKKAQREAREDEEKIQKRIDDAVDKQTRQIAQASANFEKLAESEKQRREDTEERLRLALAAGAECEERCNRVTGWNARLQGQIDELGDKIRELQSFHADDLHRTKDADRR